MNTPVTNKMFAKAVCAELGIDPMREGQRMVADAAAEKIIETMAAEAGNSQT